MWAIVRDITERKRAEEALRTEEARRQSEVQFRTLANAIPQLCWMARADGWLFWYNERWYEYTGTTPAQMEGWGWQSVHDPEALPEVLERWKDSIATGKPFDMVFPLRGADGVFRPFLTRVMPVHDQDGKVNGWFGTNTDVSEQRRTEEDLRQASEELEKRIAERTAELEARKRAEEAVKLLNQGLEQRNAQLAQANHDLESFTYSMAHDLRSPLRGMDGFSLALLEEYGPKLDDEAQNYLKRIRAAAVRMGELIDDLLNLSRIWRAEVRREKVDLSTLALAVASDLRKSESERPVEFVIEPGLAAEGDPHLLHVALENLLGNAWKFSAGRQPARIEFGVTDSDGRRPYFVRDNGVGFDMAYVGKLFAPFQRLHAANEFPGSGVGLACVERIVRKHGGNVWAEGAVNKGATFYFTLEGTVESRQAKVEREG
jgi:PAS domain S-box-containing protein